MNIFDKLKSDHIVINFIDEDGNNTLMLMKNSQSMYIYTDYNNSESFTPIKIEVEENLIKLNCILPGDKKINAKIRYEDNMRLHVYKETNNKIIVDGFVIKDETTNKRRNIFAFSGDFIE